MTAPASLPAPAAASPRGQRTRVGLVLCLILLLGAYVRGVPRAGVYAGGSMVLTDGDSYYHLRRVEQTLARGALPMFDPELAHPHGMALQWHGGYDLPLTAVIALLCGTTPARSCLEHTAARSTPVVGTAGILLVYALGAATAGPAVGLLAALSFAVYPWSAGSAQLGSVDHHVLEPLLPALWLLLLARRRMWLAALACAWALSAVPSALAPILATAVAALGAQVVLHTAPVRARLATQLGTDGPASAAPIAVAPMLTWSAALAIPLVLTSPFASRFDVNGLSFLHLSVLALAAALSHGIERALRISRAATMRALGVALAIVAGVGFFLWPTLSRFSGSEGLWGEVAQLRSLALGFTGYAICTLVSLGLCTYGVLRARALDAPLLALLSLLQPLIFLPGVVQMRYLMPASVPFAVMLAFALVDGSAALRRRVRHERPRAQALAALVSLSVLVLALLPALQTVRPEPEPTWPKALIRVLTRGRAAAAVHGRGALLADWRFGHHGLYFAGLPVLASPFMWVGREPFGPDPNVAARRALLSGTPEALLTALDALDCRYLLLSEPFDVAQSARTLGLTPPAKVAARELLDRTRPTPAGLQLLAHEATAQMYVRVMLPPRAPTP